MPGLETPGILQEQLAEDSGRKKLFIQPAATRSRKVEEPFRPTANVIIREQKSNTTVLSSVICSDTNRFLKFTLSRITRGLFSHSVSLWPRGRQEVSQKTSHS